MLCLTLEVASSMDIMTKEDYEREIKRFAGYAKRSKSDLLREYYNEMVEALTKDMEASYND